MPAKWLPTADYLRECLDYNPATGALTWKTRPLHHFKHVNAQAAWNARFAGKVAGAPGPAGYIHLSVKDRPFRAHQLIWLIQTSKWPKQIDHKNRNPADNRWDNLREATTQQNAWNRVHPKVRPLPRGVTPNEGLGRPFRARVDCDGKFVSIGAFATPEAAHAAWCAFVRRERGEFFRAE